MSDGKVNFTNKEGLLKGELLANEKQAFLNALRQPASVGRQRFFDRFN